MTYASTLNKLLSIYRRKGHENRRLCVLTRFADLHEATQQTRLIFETEPGLVANQHIVSQLLDAESAFMRIAEILEQDFNQRSPRRRLPSSDSQNLRTELKSDGGALLKT